MNQPTLKRIRVDRNDADSAFIQENDATKRLESIRERLVETKDPHLQAKLLLEFSDCAISPSAQTEAAIDFLFSFLQQNQVSSGKEDSQNGSSGSSAVVVGAIVRGLRRLLAVKASVVKPMIQIDAMGEQLTQCISVPEDFKLRHDMIHIVVDCLLIMNKYREAERLLVRCIGDHDHGLRSICLKYFLRLIDAGYILENVDSLCKTVTEMLQFERNVNVRVLSARVLGSLANEYADKACPRSLKHASSENSVPSVQEGNVYGLKLCDRVALVLASAVRDDSWVVRQEISISFRLLIPHLSPDTLKQLLQKKPIPETLVDVEQATSEMMSSGALLTLLEDHDLTVSEEASKSIRTLGDHPDQCTEALLDRVVSALMEVTATISSREGLLTTLGTFTSLLHARKQLLSTDYPIDGEEISHLLGTCSYIGVDLDILHILLSALILCDLSTIHVLKPMIEFLLQLPHIRVMKQVPNDINLKRAILKLIYTIGAKSAVIVGRVAKPLIHALQTAGKSRSRNPDGSRVFRDICCEGLINGASGVEFQDDDTVEHEDIMNQIPTMERSDPPVNAKSALGSSSLQQYRRSSDLPLIPIYRSLLQIREFVEQPVSKWVILPHAIVLVCTELYMDVSAIRQRCSATLSNRVQVELIQLRFLVLLGSQLTTSMEKSSVMELIELTRTNLQDYSGWQYNDTTRLEQWIHLLDRNRDDELELNRLFIETVRLTWPSALFDHMDCVHRSRKYVNADIVEPLPWSEPHDVTSMLPFECQLKCILHHVSSAVTVFAKIRLPNQEIIRVKLLRTRTINHTASELMTTLRIPFAPFSDPSSFSITICMASGGNDIVLSETLNYPIQHRAITSGRP